MSSPTELDIATGDETIDGANLQASIDALLAMSKSLDASLSQATEVEDLQAIAAMQAELNDRAMALVAAQISLMAGQVKVTADHVNAATTYAKDAIGRMADWKKKIAAMGKVVDFCGAVISGDGGKILETAFKLKDVL